MHKITLYAFQATDIEVIDYLGKQQIERRITSDKQVQQRGCCIACSLFSQKKSNGLKKRCDANFIVNL